MRRSVPTVLGVAGGAFIVASGIVSAWLGRRHGLFLYEPDPSGRFGHIGLVAGLVAIAIGTVIVVLSPRRPAGRRNDLIVSVLIMALGHAGAVAGALIIGTAGMVMCYVAGIWRIIRRGCKT